MTTPTDQQPLNKERLAKLLRMLSSPSDGEALAAVRALDRALKAAGKSFDDLAEMLAGKLIIVEAPKLLSTHYSDACKWLLANFDLTEKEERFVKDIQRRFRFNIDFQPSPAQAKWFTDLVKRCSEKASA